MKPERLYAFFELEFNRIKAMSLKNYFKKYLVLPGLFILFYLLIGKGIGSLIKNLNYSNFVAPGMLAFFVFIAGFSIGQTSFKEKAQEHLKELLALPIDRKIILFGRMIRSVSLISLRYLILLLLLIPSGMQVASLFGLLLSIPLFIVAFLLSFSIGAIISLKTESNLYSLLSWPIAFLTPAFYPIEKAPTWLKSLIFLNPITYIVDGFRNLLIGNSVFSLGFDLLVVSSATFILILLSEKLLQNLEF